MREWFKKHKETALASGISLFLILSGYFLVWYKLRSIKEPLVLHYSTYTGINQVGNVREVAGIAVTGIVLWFMDTILAIALNDREKFWGRVASFVLLSFGILLFFAFIAIIALNS